MRKVFYVSIPILQAVVFPDDGRLGFVPGVDGFREACDTFSVGRSNEARTRSDICSNVHVASRTADGWLIRKNFGL
jgi:hypothetical protein